MISVNPGPLGNSHFVLMQPSEFKPNRPSSAASRVAATPELLHNILAFLDNGEPDVLLRCLPVSKAFFDCAAHILCQRITVPAYEFTVSRARDPVIYEETCPSCKWDFPYIPPPVPGTTTHTPREKFASDFTSAHACMEEGGKIGHENKSEDGGEKRADEDESGVSRAGNQLVRVQDDGGEGAKEDQLGQENGQGGCKVIGDNGADNTGLGQNDGPGKEENNGLDEPSAFIKRMYSHVRVLNIEPHSRCTELGSIRPLPNLRTVIACGGFHPCDPINESQSACGLLPSHPFRLILDGLCPALLCKRCTSPLLLTPNVDTLVLRLRYDLGPQFCRPMEMLPTGCRPKRLVVMFPMERFRESIFPDDLDDENHRYWMSARPFPPFAGTPSELEEVESREKRNNWFFRIAEACLLVPDDCIILIVGADQSAIYTRNFSAHDASLPKDPNQPEPRSRPTALQDLQRHLLRRPLPVEPYISEYEKLWLSTSDISYDTFGLVYLLDGVITAGLDADHQVEPGVSVPDRYVHGPEYNPHAVYGQSGRIVSARLAPGLIDSEQLPAAMDIIQRRAAVMKSILHVWIDEVLDRLPTFPWETEQSEWQDRRDFDRYHTYIKAVEEDEAEMERTRAQYERWAAEARDDPYDDFNIEDMAPIKPAKLEELDTWKEGLRFAPTKDELAARRSLKHKNILFMTMHEYHRLEGNNDEVDDPSLYL